MLPPNDWKRDQLVVVPAVFCHLWYKAFPVAPITNTPSLLSLFIATQDYLWEYHLANDRLTSWLYCLQYSAIYCYSYVSAFSTWWQWIFFRRCRSSTTGTWMFLSKCGTVIWYRYNEIILSCITQIGHTPDFINQIGDGLKRGISIGIGVHKEVATSKKRKLIRDCSSALTKCKYLLFITLLNYV